MKNKKIFSLIAVIFLGLVLIASPFLFTGKVKNFTWADYNPNHPIRINKSYYDIVVGEDGVLSVSQTVEITFLQSGLSEILFYVPYIGTIYREDEPGKVTQTKYLAKIYDYSLDLGQKGNEELKFYHDESSGYVTFGVKNPSGYYYNGDTKAYTLNFKYDMSNSGTNLYDEIYYNFADYNTAMPIYNIMFKITFPKTIDFDNYAPAIYYEKAGSTTEFTDFSIQNGNTIVSNNPFSLNAYESLTIRQLLPKGYLNVSSPNVIMPILGLIISVALSVVIIILKFKNKQVGEVVSPVEFNAPEGISPDVAEFYYKHKVSNKSAGALIIYLANKGYISVTTSEDEKHEPLTLKKVKDLPENEDNNIKRLFNTMFSSGEIISIDALNNSAFYGAFNSLQLSVATNHGERMFEPKSKKGLAIANNLIIIPLILNVCFMFLASFIRIGFLGSFTYLTLFTALVGFLSFVLAQKYNKLWIAIIGVLATSLCSIFVNSISLHLLDNYYLMAIANIIAVLPIIFVFKPKYSENAAKIRGSVLGLKNYINLAEKDRLEMLVKDNPNYYFDILPYAYVLDVSEVWMNKFKDIKISAPMWIENSVNINLFDVIVISSIINNLNMTVNNSVFAQAVQASSRNFRAVGRSIGRIGRSGGGFSGGGFSGGGGGGTSIGAR